MDLSRLADQRAQRPDSSILPREEREARTPMRPVQTVTEERPEAPLTRREQRVKEILLKELGRLNTNGQGWEGLSYVEKQRLEKRLDVDYLDREIAKMRTAVRWLQRASRFLVPSALALAAFVLAVTFFGLDLEGGFEFNLGLYVAYPFLGALFARLHLQSTRRRLFIYEALRELSDADELDVVLSRAVEDADRLIRQLVAREFDAAPARPLS